MPIGRTAQALRGAVRDRLRRASVLVAAVAAALLCGCARLPALDAATATATDAGIFFDDFSEPDLAVLQQAGWVVRTRAGHPGVAGAAWGAESLALVDDPHRPGNRLLRLTAHTDGTPAGTQQAQLCQARKFLEGTYAARVRFSDAPTAGPTGDIVVQTFYAVSPLRFAFDPQYSELDWEYLPHGGWGEARTRLYAVSWQTVRLDPWAAYNQPFEAFRSMAGWHVLLMQVAAGRTHWYIDGAPVAEHGGRNYPVVPMAISFSQWFVDGALQAAGTGERVYTQDVDWVFHARDRVLSPAEVGDAVAALRRAGRTRVDSVPAAQPPLDSPCDF
jgi:hypothetical protein